MPRRASTRQHNTTRIFLRREEVPTYPLQALCSVQYAIYNVQCAICNLCNMQCAIWNMQYAICRVQCAKSQQKRVSLTHTRLSHTRLACVGEPLVLLNGRQPPISIPPSLQPPLHPLVYSPPSIPLPPSTNPLPPPYPSHPLSVALSQHSLTKPPDILKQLPLSFTTHIIL